jgi:hypothetical protein
VERWCEKGALAGYKCAPRCSLADSHRHQSLESPMISGKPRKNLQTCMAETVRSSYRTARQNDADLKDSEAVHLTSQLWLPRRSRLPMGFQVQDREDERLNI